MVHAQYVQGDMEPKRNCLNLGWVIALNNQIGCKNVSVRVLFLSNDMKLLSICFNAIHVIIGQKLKIHSDAVLRNVNLFISIQL